MNIVYILLLISCVIFLVYNIFLRKHVKVDTPSINWSTTLLSVIIAALVGIAVFFTQNAWTDAQNRQQHLDLIKEELRSNLEDLQDKHLLTIVRGHTTNNVLDIDLQGFCMTQAIQSRLFNEKETKQLYIMVNAFHKHRRYQEYLKAMLQEPSENRKIFGRR